MRVKNKLCLKGLRILLGLFALSVAHLQAEEPANYLANYALLSVSVEDGVAVVRIPSGERVIVAVSDKLDTKDLTLIAVLSNRIVLRDSLDAKTAYWLHLADENGVSKVDAFLASAPEGQGEEHRSVILQQNADGALIELQ